MGDAVLAVPSRRCGVGPRDDHGAAQRGVTPGAPMQGNDLNPNEMSLPRAGVHHRSGQGWAAHRVFPLACRPGRSPGRTPRTSTPGTRGVAGVSCTPSMAPQCGHASLVGSVTVDWSSSVTGYPQRRDPGSAGGCDPRLEGDRAARCGPTAAAAAQTGYRTAPPRYRRGAVRCGGCPGRRSIADSSSLRGSGSLTSLGVALGDHAHALRAEQGTVPIRRAG
jgi:hypothetical protein